MMRLKTAKAYPAASTALIPAACCLLLVGLGTYHPRANAEADGPDFYRVSGVAADDVLNIRAEPTSQATKVGSIPPNADCVRNLGCQGGLSLQEFTTLNQVEQARRLQQNPRWCQIQYQGIKGWVAGRYLVEGGCQQ
jgi:uncharacterized protein YgiM (DUF1202 family)